MALCLAAFVSCHGPSSRLVITRKAAPRLALIRHPPSARTCLPGAGLGVGSSANAVLLQDAPVLRDTVLLGVLVLLPADLFSAHTGLPGTNQMMAPSPTPILRSYPSSFLCANPDALIARSLPSTCLRLC